MSKSLYKNYWIDLKQTDRGFVYAQRRNINSTASLLFVKNNKGYKFLLRYQPLPELQLKSNYLKHWNQLYPCCVTGSLELAETPIQNVIKEIYEETNYIVKKKDIKISNISVSSTQMNECVYTFVVDITHAKFVKKQQGDGSIFENISQNKWVSHQRLKKILNQKKQIYLSSLASAYLLFESHILKRK